MKIYQYLINQQVISGKYSQTVCTRNRFANTPQLHQFSVTVYLHQSAVACLCQDYTPDTAG
ncbi:hypothetical protein [Cronobacter dublinensis]|uniref:hypothetical protein n=1 Tax=Cronobacter dublinensis TaxID=413497 RepID=UPI003AF673BD